MERSLALTCSNGLNPEEWTIKCIGGSKTKPWMSCFRCSTGLGMSAGRTFLVFGMELLRKAEHKLEGPELWWDILAIWCKVKIGYRFIPLKSWTFSQAFGGKKTEFWSLWLTEAEKKSSNKKKTLLSTSNTPLRTNISKISPSVIAIMEKIWIIYRMKPVWSLLILKLQALDACWLQRRNLIFLQSNF